MSLKTTLVSTACMLGGFHLAKQLTAGTPKVLMYHRFSDGEEHRKLSVAAFSRQIEILKRGYNVLTISAICEAMRQGQPIPKHTIAITVDDGYDDFYRFAYPVLKHYELPATIYVTTDFIDRKLWLWPDKVAYLVNHTRLNRMTLSMEGLGDRVLPLTTTTERHAAWLALNDYCVSINHQARLDFIDQLARDLAVTVTPEPADEYAPMSWEALCEVAANGIEIGAHSRTHPVLSTLDRDSLRAEIQGSKTRIEQMLLQPINAFCYPNGQREDYNDLVKQVVIESGFSTATAAFHDKAIWEDYHEIRRYSVWNDLIHFRKVINGVETLSDRLA